jgi:hypothetical protein
VSESKAGTKGRCPICGGRLTVPQPIIPPTPLPVSELQPQPFPKAIWAASAGVLLLIGIGVVVALSGHHKSRATEAAYGVRLTPDQQGQLDVQMIEIGKLEDMVRRFRESSVKERHLRARDVLMKINSYEPVTNFEYALRGQVLQEEEKAGQSAGNSIRENDPWKLNTPLEPSEKDELVRLSDDLQAQSAKLASELSTVGISVTPVKDPLGRALLDGAEVSRELIARRESIVKDAAHADP